MKKRKGRILVLFLAVLLVSVTSCKNPFLKKMLVEEEKGSEGSVPEKPQEPTIPKHTVTFGVDGGLGTLKAKADGIAETDVSPITIEQGKTVTFTAEPAAGYVIKEWKVDGTVVTGNTSNSYTHSVTAAVDVKVSFDAPFVEGGASLILNPDKLTIKVKAKTSDGSAVAVEGCTETSLASGNSTYTELHATGPVVIFKGKITELYCGNFDNNGIQNTLAALNVQGLSALKTLYCGDNKLTVLNVQGLSNLKYLDCYENQLTVLDVQDCTALQYLRCYENQLTALNVHGCTALKSLNCYGNRLNDRAFIKIFKDLPQSGGTCYLYTEEPGVTEGNHTDFTAPSAVQAAFQNAKTVKHWTMYKQNTSGTSEEI